MMPPFPFPHYPYSNRRFNPNFSKPFNESDSPQSSYFPSQSRPSTKNDFSKELNFSNEFNFSNDSNDTDNNFIDFFGIKLYFDDLLIIGLLIFLYNEDVKDTYLYIALILLLLS